ncbi:unnamed protein product [Acanthoscelides obtectus]|uniref:HTH psq-type domain-containing protein n=1 Tax=Acanthoscelides obtectus TaxID=200917 RepID=A0A9P0MLD4_ACAOB|nr:unnamed protein product [Acanthoscelides obtectus]CAK1660942.1 hypothetical protein AOBTE_LOCUS22351 [Acanthoscelides obtectus]
MHLKTPQSLKTRHLPGKKQDNFYTFDNNAKVYVSKKRPYDKKDMETAPKLIDNGTLSLRDAAKQFKVDKSALSRRRTRSLGKQGRKTSLTKEMERNRLSQKKLEQLERCRTAASDPFIIFGFYARLNTCVSDFKLQDKPRPIWNLDEISFSSDPTRIKGVAGIVVSESSPELRGVRKGKYHRNGLHFSKLYFVTSSNNFPRAKFMEQLESIWNEGLSAKTIKSSVEKVGIFPCDKNIYPEDRLDHAKLLRYKEHRVFENPLNIFEDCDEETPLPQTEQFIESVPDQSNSDS